MRLFVAITFTDDMKKQLTGFMHELKLKGITGNYTPAANLHLTMCFIGETTERKVIKEALSGINFKPFKLSLTDAGRFGDLLYVGTRGGQAINALAADIRKALDEAGIDYDRKKFKPHITLVRKMNGSVSGVRPPKAEMTVQKISLMKSERKDGRLVYMEV